MTYSPECVAAYIDRFPLPDGVEIDPEPGLLVWRDDIESDFMDEFTTRYLDQLRGFAANWERVKELEEVLARLQRAAERAFLGAHANAYAFLPIHLESYNKADAAARKLLEKGNE